MFKKRQELGLPVDDDTLDAREVLEPFYKSLNNPSDSDLEYFFAFMYKFPALIMKPMENTYQAKINGALDLLRTNPTPDLATALSEDFKDEEGNDTYYYSGKPDLASKVKKTQRSKRGELLLKDEKANLADDYRVFVNEKLEKQGAFTKWCFRRGRKSTENLSAMLGALKTAKNSQEYVQQVHLKIPK